MFESKKEVYQVQSCSAEVKEAPFVKGSKLFLQLLVKLAKEKVLSSCRGLKN